MKITLLLFLLFSHSLIMAASDKDKELHQVQSKIKTVSGNLSRLKQQQDDANRELKRIEKQYGEISRTVQQLSAQVKQKQQRINEIQKELKVQNHWLSAQKSHLAGQVKAAYALGRQEELKLLLNQKDGSRSSRIMTYYQYFNNARLDKLQRINNSLKLLTTLEQEKQLERQQVADLMDKSQQQQAQLKETAAERKTLLIKIKKDYQNNTSQLSRLKKNEQKLKRLITSLQQKLPDIGLPAQSKQPFHTLQGSLPWPVAGKIIKSFGNQRSDSQWDGILLKAQEGNPVQAIAHGQVIFSDWFKGYGLLVIIKHDKNYMSLYAFNQSLYKEKGDWVEAGDTIATVGKSDGREDASLYFEIRRKDKPLNPIKWCKKKR
ncbi:MAG: peptidoglycan DD-metalloendopeptidase family protein [Methyloprofundus sp.]|nr:peptidoglycan DD-metalloendopeptidase family protein [Methyloprofundus sp.]